MNVLCGTFILIVTVHLNLKEKLFHFSLQTTATVYKNWIEWQQWSHNKKKTRSLKVNRKFWTKKYNIKRLINKAAWTRNIITTSLTRRLVVTIKQFLYAPCFSIIAEPKRTFSFNSQPKTVALLNDNYNLFQKINEKWQPYKHTLMDSIVKCFIWKTYKWVNKRCLYLLSLVGWYQSSGQKMKIFFFNIPAN